MCRAAVFSVMKSNSFEIYERANGAPTQFMGTIAVLV